MNRKLLIVGAGQYGAVAYETAEAMGCFDKIVFLDDYKTGENIVGKLSDYESFTADYRYAFVAIGNPEIRLKLIQKLEEAVYSIAVLVHPSAYISPSAQLQKGCIIEPNATVQANSVLATGAIVSAGAVVNHDCFIGDCCHIDVGAVVKSGSVVKMGTKVEAGEVFAGTNLTEYYFEAGM